MRYEFLKTTLFGNPDRIIQTEFGNTLKRTVGNNLSIIIILDIISSFIKRNEITSKANDNGEDIYQISLIPLTEEIYGKRRKGVQNTYFLMRHGFLKTTLFGKKRKTILV